MARVVIYMAEWCSICRGTIKRIVPALSDFRR
nr:MAG TPA: Thioredoxin [Caudoviricetes sp.]